MIKLKTKYDERIVSKTHLSGYDDDYEHDALAAHAYEMAVEELYTAAADRIKSRAAEILARLLKGEKP